MTPRWRRVVQGLVGLALFVGVLGGGQPPAEAADTPAGCAYYAEEHNTVSEDPDLMVYPGSAGFLRCTSPQSSGECFESLNEATQWDKGTSREDAPVWYCAEEGHTWHRCRTDIRWTLNPIDGEDETSTWDSTDTQGYVVIPEDLPDSLTWWVNELVAENAVASDDDYEGGQGCAVAATYPEYATCEEINDQKEELREEIEDLEARQGQDSSQAPPGREGHFPPDPARLREARAELHDLENVGGLIPDDCFGNYPSDRYEITWSNADDEDGDEDDMASSNRIMGWLANIIFSIGKSAVVIMLWLVRLAFTFDISQYRIAVGDFASRIDRNLVHLGEADLSLFNIAWFALFAYAGFQALRGRVGRAAGEIGMAVVLASIGVVLIGNFFPREDDHFNSTVTGSNNAYDDGSYFDSVGGLLNASSLAMLRVANPETSAVDEGGHPAHNQGEPPVDLNISGEDLDRQEVEDLIRATNGRLHMEFIERPYYYINYGRDEFDEEPEEDLPASDIRPNLNDNDVNMNDDIEDHDTGYDFGSYRGGASYPVLSCQEVVNATHSLPETDATWVRRFQRRNGCGDMAEWNQTMNPERLMAATLVTAVALVVAVGLGLAAITLLMLKFMVAVLFVALPFAVVMAILPGRSRSLGFGWATNLLQLWLAALGTSMILAVVLMGVDAVNATSQDRPLAERWTMILLVVATLFVLRKRIVSSSQSVANTLQDRLTASTGETANWGGGGGRGGRLNDMDLGGVDRGAARAGMAGRLAMIAGGAMAVRAGTRVAGAAWHMGPGGIRRSVVAEYGRRRTAALGQAWHWRNTMEGQRVAQARAIKQDPSKSREGVLDKEFGEHQPPGSTLQQSQILVQRRINAAAAQQDYARLQKAGNKALNPGEEQNAAARLLGRHRVIDWNNGNKQDRQRMLQQAGSVRDDVVASAGGRERVGSSHQTAATQQIRAWNSQGGITYQPTHRNESSHLDRESGLDAPKQQSLLNRDDELRQSGVQSKAEADAKLNEHNM